MGVRVLKGEVKSSKCAFFPTSRASFWVMYGTALLFWGQITWTNNLESELTCPQNGSAVLKGSSQV